MYPISENKLLSRRLFLRLVGASGLVATLPQLNISADNKKERVPNIVFIFADDWGWGDLSAHGHPYVKTPNIDNIAAQGINFQQFNVLNPVCSPSRAAVLTGHFPARHSVHQHFALPEQNSDRGMPDWLNPKASLLPKLLQSGGYRTGMFGKWHLTNDFIEGAPTPDHYGFDEWQVFNGGADWPSAGRLTPHDVGSRSAKFILDNKDKPFFVNVWLHEPHTPHIPTEQSMKEFGHLNKRDQVYAAVIADGDQWVGTVLDALKEAGVEKNTIVIFASDNGPEISVDNEKVEKTKAAGSGYGRACSVGTTGGLRSQKRSLFEGGVCTPFIMRWPDEAPAGQVNETTVLTAVDLFPTFCTAAGIILPEYYESDGENLIDAFKGKHITRTKPIFGNGRDMLASRTIGRDWQSGMETGNF